MQNQFATKLTSCAGCNKQVVKVVKATHKLYCTDCWNTKIANCKFCKSKCNRHNTDLCDKCYKTTQPLNCKNCKAKCNRLDTDLCDRCYKDINLDDCHQCGNRCNKLGATLCQRCYNQSKKTPKQPKPSIGEENHRMIMTSNFLSNIMVGFPGKTNQLGVPYRKDMIFDRTKPQNNMIDYAFGLKGNTYLVVFADPRYPGGGIHNINDLSKDKLPQEEQCAGRTNYLAIVSSFYAFHKDKDPDQYNKVSNYLSKNHSIQTNPNKKIYWNFNVMMHFLSGGILNIEGIRLIRNANGETMSEWEISNQQAINLVVAVAPMWIKTTDENWNSQDNFPIHIQQKLQLYRTVQENIWHSGSSNLGNATLVTGQIGRGVFLKDPGTRKTPMGLTNPQIISRISSEYDKIDAEVMAFSSFQHVVVFK